MADQVDVLLSFFLCISASVVFAYVKEQVFLFTSTVRVFIVYCFIVSRLSDTVCSSLDNLI